MHDANSLPNDVTGCHQLLLAAYKQSVELERHATQAEQRVAQSEQQVAELNRVLDETAASYQELQQEHAATLDELTWYKRLERGTFQLLTTTNDEEGIELDYSQLVKLLGGLDLRTGRRRRRYRRVD